MSTGFNWDDLFTEALKKATLEIGKVNIVVAGRSGVGKSTLLNAVFRGELATVGQGRPVTEGTREYSREGFPFTILDTRGLEMQDYEPTVTGLTTLIRQRRSDPDANRHIHVAWACVAEDSRRVEAAESHLTDRLGAVDLPIIGVITKARSDKGFRGVVQELLPDARQVVRVRSIAEEFDDGHELPPMGLEELAQATSEVLPEGVRNAFAAAQKVSIELQVQRARKAVMASSTAAAAVAATPIAFADAFLLVPLQTGMLATVTKIFGIPVGRDFLATLLSSAVGVSLTTLTGRAVVTNLLKLCPGAGTIAGGAIAAGTAATLTATLGEAYTAALARLVSRGGSLPTPDAIVKEFSEEWLRRKSRGAGDT